MYDVVVLKDYAPIVEGFYCDLCDKRKRCIDMRDETDDAYGVSLCEDCLVTLLEYMRSQ